MSTFIALHAYSDWGLFALRLALAIIFLVHGPKKMNGAMGGFMAFIGLCETVGALALLVGILTQLAALGIAIIMLGAIWKKINTWHVPFSAMDKMGWEFDLIILAGCLALLTVGGGTMSLDSSLWGL